jgi:ABC-type transporter Mla MlaB component
MSSFPNGTPSATVALRKRVLRISITEAADEQVTLQLDGQMSGRWVELLQKTCEVQMKKAARVTIDLKNVSFADRDGIALIRSLTARRVELLNASPFLAEQIRNAPWY